MKQVRIPAVFMRGGTSNAIVFHAKDLPRDRAQWDEIFLAAIGSPDPYGRQLDGMGGGVSSLSKVCVIGPATRPDADIDYTFAQVQIKDALVDYTSNCGNMSSAMGPFAVDEGLIKVSGSEVLVRVHNTNTKKVIWSRFTLDDGQAAVDGDLAIPGVSGTGAPVRLEFRDPGGATTGKLLPTGNAVDTLDVPGYGKFEASLVDAANATCFLNAADLGLKGTEMPEELDRNAELLKKLAAIRIAASVAMGIGKTPEEAAAKRTVPFIGFVSGPQDATALSGDRIEAGKVDLTARMLSNGQPHRALPLTVSLCTAVAARIAGSVVNRAARLPGDPDAE
ncbi:MAG: PrpF family protein, partial [Burkholderiales bacterium]|nr:PrpF family protein [Burkholderiales bacterium]